MSNRLFEGPAVVQEHLRKKLAQVRVRNCNILSSCFGFRVRSVILRSQFIKKNLENIKIEIEVRKSKSKSKSSSRSGSESKKKNTHLFSREFLLMYLQ